MFSLEEIYDLGIRIEKNGEKFYREAQKQILDKGIKALLTRLADDEIKHVDFFTRKKAALKLKPEDPELEQLASTILQGILGDQTFSLKEANPADLKNTGDLLKLAIEFEKDTVLFYEMLRALEEKSATLKGLQEIIEEENHHVQMLEEMQGERIFRSALR